MPQKLHKEWEGFERLLSFDENQKIIPGVPAKARCKKCRLTFSKTSQKFMRTHKTICGTDNNSKKNKGRRTQLSPLEPSDDSNDTPSDIHLNDDETGENQLDLSSRDNFLNNSNGSQCSSSSESPQSFQGNHRYGQRQRSFSITSIDEDLVTQEDSSLSEVSRTSTTQQAPYGKTRRRKQSGKRQISGSDNNGEQASNDDKAIALYKYFLCSNIDYDQVESPSMMNLLKTFDCHFRIPSANELQTVIGSKAADEVCGRNHDKQHNGILQLIVQLAQGRVEIQEDGQTHHHDNKVMALTLLGSSKDEWTYIKHLQFMSVYGADLSAELDNFCNESVLEAKQEYGIDVLFLLHDGKYKLKEKTKLRYEDDTDITYYKVCEVIHLLKKLNCSLVSNSENHRAVGNFYDQIQTVIPEAIISHNLTMSVAISCIFAVMDLLDEENQAIVCTSLAEIISPLHLSTKVFHPASHTNVLDEKAFKPLFKLFCDFQVRDGPESIADIVPYYLQKSGSIFKKLYTKNTDAQPKKFWEISKLDQNIEDIKLLAEYALQLLQIPAHLKDVDLQDIFNKREKHTLVMDDFNKVFFTYLLD